MWKLAWCCEVFHYRSEVLCNVLYSSVVLSSLVKHIAVLCEKVLCSSFCLADTDRQKLLQGVNTQGAIFFICSPVPFSYLFWSYSAQTFCQISRKIQFVTYLSSSYFKIQNRQLLILQEWKQQQKLFFMEQNLCSPRHCFRSSNNKTCGNESFGAACCLAGFTKKLLSSLFS